MNSNDANFAVEMAQLREAELVDKSEPATRLIASAFAGVLIFLYIGWISALIWPVYYSVSVMLHRNYVVTRTGRISRNQVILAAVLFANLLASFGWLPLALFIEGRRELMLIGAAMIGSQMLFLVRRSDTLALYNFVQIVLIGAASLFVFISFLPGLDSLFAIFCGAMSLLGLNYYFTQSLRVARRLRLGREAASRQANQSQKLAAIGQLAGGVAHDFNNNLTAIIGSLELAKQTENAVERNADIANALVAARQAATTVKHLMIFARKEKPLTSLIKVVDLFAELNRLTQRLIPTSIVFQTDPIDPTVCVRADNGQLLSGLINIVVNGVDAMPNGGRMTLSAQAEQIEILLALTDGAVLKPGAFAKVSLTDTGHGIPPDILLNVVDPFFTTKPTGKGTGLGLSMVSGMMKEFGGGLSITSGVEGTEVSLYFPVSDAPLDDETVHNTSD